MTDTDMLYMASLEKRNEELEAKVAELEGKHHNECGQITHYSDELAKAKELLKAAIKDFRQLGHQQEDGYGHCTAKVYCHECVLGGGNLAEDCQWRYEAEALALIGEDGVQNG